MVSHRDDHERAKRLLGIIIELNNNDDDYVIRKNESKEAFRRCVNDMKNRAEHATLQLHEIGFDTELRDGIYHLVRYKPTEDEGDEDDGKPLLVRMMRRVLLIIGRKVGITIVRHALLSLMVSLWRVNFMLAVCILIMRPISIYCYLTARILARLLKLPRLCPVSMLVDTSLNSVPVQ